MIWQELNSTDFARIDSRTPVILPITAVEQHGPHLPVATDRLIAEHFSMLLHEKNENGVLILPTVSVGYSEHHMDFAGSMTLRHETLIDVAEQYLESVVRHGFRNFIVLNSHGGNQGACQVLLERFGAARPNCRVVVATWWNVVADRLLGLNESGPGGIGHAGEFETSLMLNIAPHLVRMEAAQPRANVPTYPWAEGDLIRAPRAKLYQTMKEMTPNGAFGDVSNASAEKGKQIAAIVTEALSKIVIDLASKA